MFETFLAAMPNECAHVVVPEASELAMQYYNGDNLLWIVKNLWSLIVPLLFLMTGFSGRLGRFSDTWGKKWYLSLLIYLFLFLGISQLLNWPLDYYSDYVRQHAYGLSNQSFGRWFGNWGKSFLVTFIGAAAFVWIFYLLLKKSPKRWWFYSSLVSVGIIVIMIFITPIWISPLFNDFGPMKNKELEQKILALASKAGIEGARVYEVDMSQDTKQLNAYVTGFGATKRIVLWDTTLKQLKTDEILFVMGHEMGHYVLHHILWEILFLSAMSFLIFYLTFRSSQFLLNRYQARFGFQNLSDFASFPLLLFSLTFFLLLFSPVFNLFTRTLEHEADRFGLDITHNNQAAAEAFLALQQQNLANPRPGPIFIFWRASHPSLASRVAFCNTYCEAAKKS